MGFNTEIKHNGVVYHVQTEPRKDARIETVVYLQGAIIHSLKTVCPDAASSLDDREEDYRHRLEEQHRRVIERIKAGEIRPPAATDTGSKTGA